MISGTTELLRFIVGDMRAMHGDERASAHARGFMTWFWVADRVMLFVGRRAESDDLNSI